MPSALRVAQICPDGIVGKGKRGSGKEGKKTAIIQYGSPEDNTLSQIAQLNFGLQAAQFGARPPVISALTGLKDTISRKLFADATKSPPPPGQLPSDPTFFMSSPQIHIESLWLLQTYRSISLPDDNHNGQVECMLLTYGMYQQLFHEQSITFDRFFFLIRVTVFGKHITTESCPHCDGPYLWLSTRAYSSAMLCPVCSYNDKPQRKTRTKTK